MSEEIRELIRTINDSWLSNNPEKVSKVLSDCFHTDMVIKGCDLKIMATGRDECVRSYAGFIHQAQVKSFSQDEPDIQLTGDTATATYGWTIMYVLEGKEYTEPGHDIFVFQRANGKWLATWRAMLTESSA